MHDHEFCPDDSVCAQCEANLPETPGRGYTGWSFEGFCGPLCALRYEIDILKPLARKTPAMAPIFRNIDKAMAELFPARADDFDFMGIYAQVSTFASDLLAAGDLDALEGAFGTRDPAFDLSKFPAERVREIFEDYIRTEDHPEDQS